ncbi:hypothetical protein [Veronia pacifica]|uniref:Uncharacterized protein n=1 Tax=Veronia pacifica TaxID=1080227 RepID=A0A1C3ELA4_9GAMM|nr:hypothetical protein [Veronia pacifica]ODA34023.1 hypothetical protein A8L45_08230 [Veronia pacifica]
MLIATEKKTGSSLYGSYDESTLNDFIASFYSPEFIDEFGEPEIEVSPNVQQIIQRDEVRSRISGEVGDSDTLLGTTADGVQLLLFGFCQLVVKLNAASTLAEVREAAGPFNALATSFLTKVESGEVKLPFQVKGLESVVEDIESRATAVAEVLGGN